MKQQSLAQCKCVCREWNSINDSSFSVKKHTENVNKNLTSGFGGALDLALAIECGVDFDEVGVEFMMH
ncbi:hypothetical protein BDE02_13G129700 [Populus trichocarpa]|nr:hypothetical protein BDE02_13G129700 [Populus trichocarpa]